MLLIQKLRFIFPNKGFAYSYDSVALIQILLKLFDFQIY